MDIAGRGDQDSPAVAAGGGRGVVGKYSGEDGLCAKSVADVNVIPPGQVHWGGSSRRADGFRERLEIGS